MCGKENSQTGSTLLADSEDLVEQCGIKEDYEAYIKICDESSIYDKIFLFYVRR